MTKIDDVLTGGMILETEAYRGPEDRASHAFNNRRTKRTEVMFQKGGIAYVYLCYGIHCLFNVVTNKNEIPHAILIRAIAPDCGINKMFQRRKKKKLHFTLTSGPGSVCQALGIHLIHNGHTLTKPPIWIEDRGYTPKNIHVGPRIGIEYAKEDALLPWRFWIKEEKSIGCRL